MNMTNVWLRTKGRVPQKCRLSATKVLKLCNFARRVVLTPCVDLKRWTNDRKQCQRLFSRAENVALGMTIDKCFIFFWADAGFSQFSSCLWRKLLTQSIRFLGGCGSFQLADNTAKGLLTVCAKTSSFGLNPVLSCVTSLVANPPPSSYQTLYSRNANKTLMFGGSAPMCPDSEHKLRTDDAGCLHLILRGAKDSHDPVSDVQRVGLLQKRDIMVQVQVF